MKGQNCRPVLYFFAVAIMASPDVEATPMPFNMIVELLHPSATFKFQQWKPGVFYRARQEVLYPLARIAVQNCDTPSTSLPQLAPTSLPLNGLNQEEPDDDLCITTHE